jgi:hypothetical protein
LGKQIYLSYPSSESVSQHLFDLVHSDVWDPAPFISKGGRKYYIIFIDDFSCHTWIYFLKNRSEPLSIYKTFSFMVHTHFDTFSSGLQGGIPCAHAQIGVTKCKHHYLLQIDRALMIASSVSPQFWAEAISTTTYLINIQPSSALQGGIPFERLCDKMPDYSSLYLFGCVCYVLLASRERTKLTV